MKIKGQLTVPHSLWKEVYNSVINFLNQEIKIAYKTSLTFYENNKSTSIIDMSNSLEAFLKKEKTSDYQNMLIKSALFSGTNTKMYKPKKSNFAKYTNRTTSFSTESISLSFFKKDLSILLETCEFENFDKFIAKNKFISEFITMVNTIDWPTRQGPSKSTRGCILYTLDDSKGINIFYKTGNNPPELSLPGVNDQTTPEPSHLKSNIFKNIKLVNTNTKAETYQPLPEE